MVNQSLELVDQFIRELHGRRLVRGFLLTLGTPTRHCAFVPGQCWVVPAQKGLDPDEAPLGFQKRQKGLDQDEAAPVAMEA